MAVLAPIDGHADTYLMFCPGCKHGHVFDERWKFDGNLEKPSFGPSSPGSAYSYLDHGSESTVAGYKGSPRCHFYLRSGLIEFLGDCGHEFAGKTVPMIEIPGTYGY